VKRLPFLFGTALLLAPSLASAASLTVTVENIRDAKGHIRIGICPRADFMADHCRYHAVLPARVGSVTATIRGVPPGTYAVEAFADTDDDGHLKKNFFGIPKEGLAISRNPPPRFGPPHFDDAAIRIVEGSGAITLALRYF